MAGLNKDMPKHFKEPHNDKDIDLKQITLLLWAKKWFIGGCILLCGILGYVIAANMTPIYQSKGSLLITTDTGPQLISGGGLSSLMSSAFGFGGSSSIKNALAILQSRSMSLAIADSLLEERYMKNGKLFPVLYNSYPNDSTVALKDTVASRLREHLIFKRIDTGTDLITIVYESPSPWAAAHVVNVTMDVYTQFTAKRKRSEASAGVQFLKQERSRIRDSLYQAEEALRKFMNKTGLLQVDTQTEELIKQSVSLKAKLYEIKAKLKAAKSAITKYEQKLNEIKPGLAKQLASATTSNMKRLQVQLAELKFKKTRLLARNPGLRKQVPVPHNLARLNRKINDYEQKIENLIQKLVIKGNQYLSFLAPDMVTKNIAEINKNLIRLRVEKQQYKAQINVLNERIAKVEQFFNQLPDNMIKLARLKREVKLNEKIYATITQQYAETKLLEQTQFGSATPIDTGYIPDKPAKPHTLLFILIGFILGGIGSIGFVLVRDTLNDKIDGIAKMHRLSEPLLAVIPQLDDYVKEHHSGKKKVTVQDKQISTKLVTVLDRTSIISESFRKLQNRLIYAHFDRQQKSVAFTGADHGAGKATTIANLGVVLAKAGFKVAIVEADLQQTTIHDFFGMERSPGITEMLFDDLMLNDAIKETVVPGLSILTAGRSPSNSSTVMQSKPFLQTIEKLKKTFDYVLVDTPPFGITTDSSALIRQTDGVVVTAQFKRTTEAQLDRTLEELYRIKAPILGTVLTGFDYKHSSDYSANSNNYKKAYKAYNEYSEGRV